MVLHLAGRTCAAWSTLLDRRRRDAGQGTVEYVALILLVAAVLAGVVAVGQGLKGGGIAEAVVHQLKGAISGVGAGK